MKIYYMFRQVYISILTLFLCFSFSGSSRQFIAQNNLPPIIDREIFFGNPEISGARISPDGKFIAFRKPYKGTMNIWVKSANEPFDRARVLTNETARPIPSFSGAGIPDLSCLIRTMGATRILTFTPSPLIQNR